MERQRQPTRHRRAYESDKRICNSKKIAAIWFLDLVSYRGLLMLETC